MAVTLDGEGGCRNGLTESGNEERPQWSGGVRGRCRARTDDLFRVKEARYQLRQSPIWGSRRIRGDRGLDTSRPSRAIAHRPRAGLWTHSLRVWTRPGFRAGNWE